MCKSLLRWFVVGVLLVSGGLAVRAEPPAGTAKPAPGSVQLMFLPPPLEEAVYSVGVYETKTNRLVRRLLEDAEDGAFTAGLNGLITFWDRRDDAGKTVPAGRYAARGWAVGEMRVEGVDILGNDWANEDEDLRITRVEAICLLPADGGLAVLAAMTDGSVELWRVSGELGEDGKPLWRKRLNVRLANSSPSGAPRASLLAGAKEGDLWVFLLPATVLRFQVADGAEKPKPPGEIWAMSKDLLVGSRHVASLAKDGFWTVEGTSLVQRPSSAPGGEPWRRLIASEGEPVPREVFASEASSRLYLLEESPGWQRVRGLEWSETKPGEAGHPVSEWKTFFERNIRRPDPALGLDEKAPSPTLELSLAKNPLEPGKPHAVKLRAGFDATGSFLETADGLRLLPVSARANLRAARLAQDPHTPGRLLFYQFDGAAWDVFSLVGAPKALVSFEAGEFELTDEGERHPEQSATDPGDL